MTDGATEWRIDWHISNFRTYDTATMNTTDQHLLQTIPNGRRTRLTTSQPAGRPVCPSANRPLTNRWIWNIFNFSESFQWKTYFFLCSKRKTNRDYSGTDSVNSSGTRIQKNKNEKMQGHSPPPSPPPLLRRRNGVNGISSLWIDNIRLNAGSLFSCRFWSWNWCCREKGCQSLTLDRYHPLPHSTTHPSGHLLYSALSEKRLTFCLSIDLATGWKLLLKQLSVVHPYIHPVSQSASRPAIHASICKFHCDQTYTMKNVIKHNMFRI